MEFDILDLFSFRYVTSILAVSLLTVFSLYLFKIWNSYNFFKKRGIKTPEYEFFYGNFREIDRNKAYSSVIQEWTKNFGKTYGYYEGHLPVLVTSDLDMIQEVFVKQHAHFSARKMTSLMRKDNDPKVNLFTSSKMRWKRMRSIINPTFSTAKLRELSPLISKCVDRLITELDNGKAEINVTNFFKRFTMDTIWNCAFGVDINIQNNKDNLYFDKCEEIFQKQSHFTLPMYLGTYFYEFKTHIMETMIFLSSKLNIKHPFMWLFQNVDQIVEMRKSESSTKKDYVQLLLDCQSLAEEIDDITAHDELNDYTETYLNKKITTDEIKTNLVVFMLAGYETTSTTLSYCAYVLSKHPDEQQKLYDEISSAFNSGVQPDADSVNQLEYLTMFIKEVLRLYPIGNSVVARRCTKPTTIKGMNIPFNLTIAVDVLSLHYDADLWGPEDPNTFNPQRFSPEIKRNPLCYMAFGNGPRNCVGMKFAMLELKLALAKLMLNYEVLPGPSSNPDEQLEFIDATVRIPKNGVTVAFKKRIQVAN